MPKGKTGYLWGKKTVKEMESGVCRSRSVHTHTCARSFHSFDVLLVYCCYLYFFRSQLRSCRKLSWSGFPDFPVDGGSLTGGKDPVVMKQEDDSSFTVKIQGAGLEAFEMQVK